MRFNAVLIILGLLAASSCECSPSVVSDRDAGGGGGSGATGGGGGSGAAGGAGGSTGTGGGSAGTGGGQATGGSSGTGGGAAALDGGQCPSDYFRAAQGCVSVTRCTLTQFETTAPTATSDRVCQQLKDCGVAGYQQQPPTATSDRVCAPLTVCQAGEYQSRPPSATSDRACLPVSTCAANQFEAAAPTATSDRLCQAVRSCTANEYEAAVPTATRDRVCNVLTSCTAVQFQTTAPTASTDRACANLTVCTATQYETVPPTATSDRTCAALTVCTATECETVLPTATRDRQCAPAVLELTPAGTQTLAMTLGQAAPTRAFEARACGNLVNANWTVDDGAAAQISPGPSSSATFTPTGAAGGLVTVTAGYRGLTARSTVQVNLSGTQNGATPAQLAQVPTTVGALVAGGGVGGVGGEGLGPTLPAADARLLALQGLPTNGASRNLRLLYPYDSTVWPRGMLAPLLQWEWTPGDAEAIRIDLSTTSGSFTWSGFFGRPAILGQLPPANRKFIRHPIPQNIWDIATNTAGKPTAAGPADKLNLTVTLVSGTTAYGPLAQTWAVAPARLTGTIYYQSYGTNLANNYTGALGTPSAFGAAVLSIRGGDTGPRLVSSASNCQVCHSVAARGARLVTQASTNNNSDTFAYELTPTGSTNAQLSKGVPEPGYPGLSPDGALMLTPGGALQSLPSNAGPNLPISGLSAVSTNLGVPAFSPNGAKVVFNPQNGVANPGRVLVVMDFNKATGAFSNPVTVKNDALTTPGDANVRPTWPQFLPDSNAVLFQQQLKVSADGNSGDAHTRKFARGRIQTVSAISSSAVNPLYRLNGLAADGTTSTLPKLNVASTLSCSADGTSVGANAAVADGDPTHTFDNAYNYEPTVSPVISGGYAWVVFTSRRLYGNVATIPPFCSDPRGVDLHADMVNNTNITTKKLWVAAISLNGQAGADTSNPAFYLPAQELLAGNARGFWVLDPCRNDGISCLTGDQCCNGFCQPNGAGGALVCSNAPRDFTCSNLQEACTTSSDCCLATAQCIGGFCAGE